MDAGWQQLRTHNMTTIASQDSGARRAPSHLRLEISCARLGTIAKKLQVNLVVVDEKPSSAPLDFSALRVPQLKMAVLTIRL
jgi:hypothetical protein